MTIPKPRRSMKTVRKTIFRMEEFFTGVRRTRSVRAEG
jgi:hypothetical protein